MNSTAGESRTNTKLTNEVKTHASEIGRLRGRINELVDELTVLKSDLDIFKQNVSRDILEVIEALKEK